MYLIIAAIAWAGLCFIALRILGINEKGNSEK